MKIKKGANTIYYRIRSVTIYMLFISISFLSYSQNIDPSDTLTNSKNIYLEEVEIIGQGTPSVYSQLARKVTIISREEINSSSASTIQDLLEYATSIDVRQRNVNGVQADIQIRGGSFDQVMILLNGINISDPQTGHFNLDLPIELASIERIEILHGSGSRIYGANAHKGVINIITKTQTNNLRAGIKFGQYGLFHYNFSGNINTGKMYNGLSISRNTSDGYTKNTDYKINHLFYQGGINFKPVDIFWQAGLNNKAFGANNFYSPRFPEQYEKTHTVFGSMTFSTNTKIKLTVSPYFRRHNDQFRLKRNEPTFYENFHMTDIAGIKGNSGFISKLGKTLLGFEYRNEKIYSTVLGNETSSPREVKGSDSIFYTKYFSRNTLNGYFEHNFTYKNFSVTGGFLLASSSHLKSKIEIFPGIDISQTILNEKVKLFGSINRSLRLPTFTDMFYKDPSNEGAIDLNPEELIGIEAGIEYSETKYSSDLTFFRDQGKGVIDWVWLTDRNLYKAMNIAEVVTQGFEIGFRFKNPASAKRGYNLDNVGVSYTFIELGKAIGNYESKYSLDYLKHKFLFNINQSISNRIHADIAISYVSRNGSYFDYDASLNTQFTKPFEPYWLTDLKFYYTFRPFVAFVNLSNLFDTKYTDVGNLIQPGRWITAGIQFKI